MDAPSGLLGQLQSVLRAAARLVLRLPARSQVSDLMHEKLHWLDINKRVTFKLCVVGYKYQHELSPGYLSSMCVSSCSIPGRASPSKASIIDCFHSSGPEGIHKILRHAWFLLRMSIHLEQSSASSEKPELSLGEFKGQLKSHLYLVCNLTLFFFRFVWS